MPFSNRTLCSISERMRNLALGLIDLAYPEARYQLTSRSAANANQQKQPDAHEWADLLEVKLANCLRIQANLSLELLR